ncbi:hypothetical protein GCM10011297_06260 [Bacterioplanes sanyensis]|uniref:thermonuclease family protein n=1 Tax=Bacterioplanes sanyensis TaxID=1249553 RepID=UPI00198A84B4|nr:thermonuclease family protein [Bacterioplanes sanyensis]GGY35976.1 hypothetical protein GCM10011297_06260 [Bacterioplanes sanyensis]
MLASILFLLRILILNLIFLSQFSLAQDAEVDRIVRVYDGDTITVDIASWPDIIGKAISVRVRGIDTPEIRGKCEAEKIKARAARDFVRQTLATDQRIQLRNLERGKYFRLVADVWVGDDNLADLLLLQQMARPYDGGQRQPWC